jgi:hypothetical protein
MLHFNRMRERAQYEIAMGMAEIMNVVFEANYQAGEANLEAMIMRLKDLSAYSLTHAEIMQQREGVELLALGMFFGMTSNQALREKNQSRLTFLSDEALAYKDKQSLSRSK